MTTERECKSCRDAGRPYDLREIEDTHCSKCYVDLEEERNALLVQVEELEDYKETYGYLESECKELQGSLEEAEIHIKELQEELEETLDTLSDLQEELAELNNERD